MFNKIDKPLAGPNLSAPFPGAGQQAQAQGQPQSHPAPGAEPSGAAPGASAKRAAKAASVISADITIEGSVIGEGELNIDGLVRGDVRVGRLSIGEGGMIEGSAFAEAIDVRGRIAGAITARQIRLYATAQVDGDLTHEQLAIESGAFFQGRSLKFQRPAEAKPAPLKPEPRANVGAERPSPERAASPEPLFEPAKEPIKPAATVN